MTAAPTPRPTLVNVGHYENFPVASIFLPRRLRRPIRAIYRFARAADDIADEGDAAPEIRLARLEAFREQLHALERGEAAAMPIFAELGEVIRQHGLPYGLFHDLLDAFAQDCTKTRYADFGEVMAYCRKSANPIGRLLLKLYGADAPRNQAYSDGICAALQIINFLQDVAVDWRKNRIYFPQDEMARFGISERQIAEGRTDGLWQVFMREQIARARKLLAAGAPLGRLLKGRIGFEMRLIILGGERILYKLHRSHGDMFSQRPTLGFSDWLYMLWRALRKK
ncbi:MAG: squalene synthase HpnC [Hydrogenophilaceae bacterium]|nr:squalene synthase HpnC [Hydrogenophilaceae bacterium]